MKTPRMLRPLLAIGVGVIALAVFIWLMVPNARNSLPGMLVLGLAAAVGIVAVVRDLQNLAEEIKHLNDPDGDQ